MFTIAGFRRTDISVLAFAQVSMEGGRGMRWGWLVSWRSSGDLAWASPTRIVWPEIVRIHNRFYVECLPSPRAREKSPWPRGRVAPWWE